MPEKTVETLYILKAIEALDFAECKSTMIDTSNLTDIELIALQELSNAR